MKKVILLSISMFVMQQIMLAGPIFSAMREDFDEAYSIDSTDEKLTKDSTDSECYSDDVFDFISIASSEQDERTDTMSIVSDVSIEKDELYMSSLFTELVQAIEADNVACVETIVRNNSTILHAQDDSGLTPLHHAFNVEDGYELNTSIIELLIGHGANQKIEDAQGISPQDLVESYKNKIEQDFMATDKDFQVVSQVYQSMSPGSPQLRKRF